MEQSEEFRNDSFHLICYENLVAIELNLVALEIYIRLDSRKIEDSSEVKRIVNIQMYPEKRLVLHWIKRSIKLLIVLVFQCARCFCPQRFHVIDDVIGLCFNLFTVFPLGLFTKGDRHGKEFAVLVKQFLYLVLLQKLFAVVIDEKHDVRSAVCLLCFVNLE